MSKYLERNFPKNALIFENVPRMFDIGRKKIRKRKLPHIYFHIYLERLSAIQK